MAREELLDVITKGIGFIAQKLRRQSFFITTQHRREKLRLWPFSDSTPSIWETELQWIGWVVKRFQTTSKIRLYELPIERIGRFIATPKLRWEERWRTWRAKKSTQALKMRTSTSQITLCSECLSYVWAGVDFWWLGWVNAEFGRIYRLCWASSHWQISGTPERDGQKVAGMLDWGRPTEDDDGERDQRH